MPLGTGGANKEEAWFPHALMKVLCKRRVPGLCVVYAGCSDDSLMIDRQSFPPASLLGDRKLQIGITLGWCRNALLQN